MLAVVLSAQVQELAAQSIRGRVLRPDGATPAQGIVVTVVDSGLSTIGRTLTNQRGEFELLVPTVGRYELRALRIGFRPTVVSAVSSSGDPSRAVYITLIDAALAIAPAIIRERNSCRLSARDGRALVQHWEQARVALTTANLSPLSGALDVHVVTVSGHVDAMDYHRDPPRGPLRRGLFPAVDTVSAREFISNHVLGTTSPDTLAARGYVRQLASGAFVFDVPPPEVLLSADFASRYCLSIVEKHREQSSWVGIRFTPQRVRDSIVDIQGTLWVERSGGGLQRLDFEYTNLPEGEVKLCDPSPDPRMTQRVTGPMCMTFRRALPRLGLGGTVDFARLESANSWIMARWTVKSPPDAFTWRFSGNSVQATGRVEVDACVSGPRCMPIWMPWPRLEPVMNRRIGSRRDAA
jgi:hypothetical protein